ncbi:o-succinylbenzoate synthase [Prevotella copri]|uniref:O-succinylbenzoate synthase n=1 Tax=Segatella copri TaxID=165179 RepID=A0A6A7VZL1_9BACT|nr:o-succinylbenzoate synthase [Segatella copri]MQM59058.1 o-succinylbenzoate synthase [Segatella copri]MQN05473.1 o-succinylbenzoate synthase [Segatella copri]MQN10651.1 o-succinylbenzoate synthase [Segatella copri]MQO61779.1 o-succinylbenzoate synthase [Segatella copri]MQO64478.1 o-succinylbenzoate synthase [Segatella copri]
MYKIEISERTLHFKQPAGTSRGVYTTRHSYYLTLTSDELPGVEGVGECATLPDLSCDAKPEYEMTLRQVCQMVEQMGRIPYDMIRAYPSITFGLETAFASFFDAAKKFLEIVPAEGASSSEMLKQKGVSVPAGMENLTELFDSPFGRGEEGITINGLVWMGTYEEMLARLEEKLQAGFHCVKLKIGAIDFFKELDLIKRIRDVYTKEQVELRVDANGGFLPENAMSQLEALAKYDIHSIEQPIKQHQWPKMTQLCRETPLPIALDEELIGVNVRSMKQALLDTVCPQYIILKPSLHGGIYGCNEWIELANQRGIGSWITSALESNIGLNAIAHYAAKVYGSNVKMPQGLGTGQLFTDNIPMPLEIRGDKLFVVK